MKQYQVQKLVEQVLEEEPQTRNSDNLLILIVVQKIHHFTKSSSFEEVMKNCQVSFESITRARRYIQKERPELKDKETENHRLEKEFEFHEFYGG